jgi:uncharacterized protein YciI
MVALGGSVKTIYALLWKMNVPQTQFEAHIPAIMDWLRELKRRGKLLGCGGAGGASWDGGLTLIEAADAKEAIAEASRSPQAAIGTTEVVEWEVYFANLVVPKDF